MRAESDRAGGYMLARPPPVLGDSCSTDHVLRRLLLACLAVIRQFYKTVLEVGQFAKLGKLKALLKVAK